MVNLSLRRWPILSTMPLEITKFGAVGDGETSCTAAIQAAIDTAHLAGGGTVLVPPGRFVTGAVELRSNINLHLDAGAVLLGSQQFDDFPLFKSRWEGDGVKPARKALLGGEGLENVSLTGRGVIDARGKIWWDAQQRAPGVNRRPLSFRVIDSRNVLVEGVTFRNSPMWTVSPLACENVVVRGVTIQNPPDSPNTDGINPDSCRNVRISDCHVDVGDDCITIKSGKEDDGRRELRPCENVVVTNCTLVHGHGGVVIGSEISGDIRNIAISNCVFVGTDRGIRIKARRGRGGVVEDLRVSNLVMDGVLCPIVVNLFYGCGAWGSKKVTDTAPQPVDDGTPRFRRFRYSNITARRVKYAAAYILGLPEMFVEDLAISDCAFYLDPENTESGAPAMASVVAKHCRSGLIARNARQLTLRNVEVRDQLGPAIHVENADDVLIASPVAHTPPSDEEPIRLDRVTRGRLVAQ